MGEGVPGDGAPPMAPPGARQVALLSEQFGKLWPGGTALALLALAVWAGWSVLPRGATGSLEVLEERAEASIPVVAPPPETPQAYSLSLAAFEDAGVAARRCSVRNRSGPCIGQGLLWNSGRTGHGFDGGGRASNVAECKPVE